MTENMKKYAALVSADEEARREIAAIAERAQQQFRQDIIEDAARRGVELVEEDFIIETPDGEIEEKVVVIPACGCFLGGAGTAGPDEERTCICVVGGTGTYLSEDEEEITRCSCVSAGEGESSVVHVARVGKKEKRPEGAVNDKDQK